MEESQSSPIVRIYFKIPFIKGDSKGFERKDGSILEKSDFGLVIGFIDCRLWHGRVYDHRRMEFPRFHLHDGDHHYDGGISGGP